MSQSNITKQFVQDPAGTLKGAGGRAITFRRLDWAPDDLVEASRWAGACKTQGRLIKK